MVLTLIADSLENATRERTVGDHQWLDDIDNWSLDEVRRTYIEVSEQTDAARRDRRYADLASLLSERELLDQVLDERINGGRLPF